MGLDTVDFLFDLEDAFAISIADTAAAVMRTPRDVVEFLQRTVPTGTSTSAVPRRGVRPDTPWLEIFPSDRVADRWKRVQQDMGATKWPRLQWFGAGLTTPTVGAKRVPGIVVA